MSQLQKENHKKVTVKSIAGKYAKGEKLAMVTCYDAAFGKLVDKSPIDMVLVGDSLGNVMLGFENTIPVTMEMMIHHGAAVSRSMSRPMVIIDMPFLSYSLSPEQALENAGLLVQQGHCEGVKLEGGKQITRQIETIVSAGIPVAGHIGLTPQHLHALGGYRVQGRGTQDGQQLIEEARALQDAGCFCLVLELIPTGLAQEITSQLQIPTIGIGAGPHTSGQVLVLHDLLGFGGEFQPRFVKHYAKIGSVVSEALEKYTEEIKSGMFPGKEHCFD